MKSYTDKDAKNEVYFEDNDDEMENLNITSYEDNPTNDDLIDLYDEQLDAFKCLDCNYESSSERGLKVHIGMKHQNTYPIFKSKNGD